MVLGKNFNWEAVVRYLTVATLGAIGMGIAFGIGLVLWLALVFNDPLINLSLTLGVSYIAYFTAQEGSDVFGILTVVTLGMYVGLLMFDVSIFTGARGCLLLIFEMRDRFFAAAAQTTFPSDARRSLHHFWEMIAYIANTLIFILSGIIMAEGIINSDNLYGKGSSWGYLVLVYVIVQFSRMIIVIVLYPALQYFGYGLTWKEAILLSWSGLRGAVGLAMALSIKRSTGESLVLTSETGSLFLFLTAGTVFLTLAVNGSTAQFLLSLLGMDELSHVEKLMLDHAKYKLKNKYVGARENLQDDEWTPNNWLTVENFMRSPTFSSSSDSLDQLNLLAARMHLLKGCLLDDAR